MNWNPVAKESIARAVGVFVAALVAIGLMPNGVFLVFPYETLAKQTGSQWHNFLSSGQVLTYCALQWGIGALLFALAGRRIRIAYLVPLAFIGIFAIDTVVRVVVASLGMSFYWEWGAH